MFMCLTTATAVTIGKVCSIVAPLAGVAVNYVIKNYKSKKAKKQRG